MDDLISRQAAIDAVKAMAVPRYKDLACEDIYERDRTLDKVIDTIRGLSSAQPADAKCCGCNFQKMQFIITQNNAYEGIIDTMERIIQDLISAQQDTEDERR